MENKNSCSCDCAIFFVTKGRIYLLISSVTVVIPAIFPARSSAISCPLPVLSCWMVESAINMSITIKSCTIKIPIESLLDIVSVLFLSERSFRITIVLEKATHNPR